MYHLLEYNKYGQCLIVVDVQPDYKEFFLRGYVRDVAEYVEKFKGPVFFLFNGPELGYGTEESLKEWWVKNGLSEEFVHNVAVFYDKGYGYFRSCMDRRFEEGIEEDQIVELVKFIMTHGIQDSKEITQKMWREWSKKHDWKNIREFLEGNDDIMWIPELMEWIKKNIKDKAILVGGAKGECLTEVEIALRALDVDFVVETGLTYKSPFLSESLES